MKADRRPTKLADVLKKRGITMPQFAPRVLGRGGKPLSVGSLRNIACGNSPSKWARRRIQQLLQTQIWEDVPLVQWTEFGLDIGDFVVFPTVEMAKVFVAEIGDSAEQHGRHVRIVGPVAMTATGEPPPQHEAVEPLLPRSDGARPAIEFWCGQEPPHSPWHPARKSQENSGAGTASGRGKPQRKTKKIVSKSAAVIRAKEGKE